MSAPCKFCGNPVPEGYLRYCSISCAQKACQERTRAVYARYSPLRRTAAIKVASALLKGTLVRHPCEVCGHSRDVVAHHDDYAKPLDIRWLCKSHHRIHHVKFGPGKNAFRAEEVA